MCGEVKLEYNPQPLIRASLLLIALQGDPLELGQGCNYRGPKNVNLFRRRERYYWKKKLLKPHVCATCHFFRQPRALDEVALGMHAMMENGLGTGCCLLTAQLFLTGHAGNRCAAGNLEKMYAIGSNYRLRI